MWGDVGEMLGRCGGDVGEMWGRCGGDVGEIEQVRDHLRLRLALEHAAHLGDMGRCVEIYGDTGEIQGRYASPSRMPLTMTSS